MELKQFDNKSFGSSKLILFFTKKLTNIKGRYSTFGRELYAAYAAIRHFKHFLKGVFTSLQTASTCWRIPIEKYSPREVKYLGYLLEFTSNIRYLKGVENIPEDTMFWTINAILLDPCTETTEFLEEQLKDQQLQKLRRDNLGVVVGDRSRG